jgi:hypothetical protein
LKLHENNIFYYFLKIIFDTNISKQLKNTKIFNFKQKQIQRIIKYDFNHKNKQLLKMVPVETIEWNPLANGRLQDKRASYNTSGADNSCL